MQSRSGSPVLFSLFLFTFSLTLHAEDALRLDFIRCTIENNHADTIKGQLWYYPPRKIALIVNHPVNQWMLLDSNHMIVYYPGEKKAFRFQSKREFALPFFQAFQSAKEGKTVFSEMGFTLRDNHEMGDTLLSIWDPPSKSRKIFGVAKMGLVKNRLATSEIDDPNGNVMVKSFFRKYLFKNGLWFPMEIEIQSYRKGRVTNEKTSFENLEPQSALPSEIQNFQIPSGDQIKDVEW